MSIRERLIAVRAGVADACRRAGRAPEAVRIVAVSKSFPVSAIEEARDAGQRDFGENYAQEAAAKIAAVPREGLCWHFIGPLQGNKTALVAAQFDWVHSVDRERIARRLSDQRPPTLPPLQVCVQVNISGEATKSGVAPDAVAALCRTVAALPNLRLRGLMAIPEPPAAGTDPAAPFRRLRQLFEALRRDGIEVDTLSAGMSADYADAIAEGSTMVRIGTALFGSRSA